MTPRGSTLTEARLLRLILRELLDCNKQKCDCGLELLDLGVDSLGSAPEPVDFSGVLKEEPTSLLGMMQRLGLAHGEHGSDAAGSVSPDSATARFACACGLVVAESGGDLEWVRIDGIRHMRTDCWPGGDGSTSIGRRDDRGSTLITALVLCAIFAAVIWACLSLAPDVEPILEQVDESVGQFIGGAL